MNLVNDDNAKRKMSSSSSENLPTTATLDCLLTNIEILSPLNLTPLTNFIRQEVISHVSTFENRCNKNWLFSGLVKLGISRFYLFILLIIFTGLTVKNMYNRSLYLLCNLIGVVYPTYRSMKIIGNEEEKVEEKKGKEKSDDNNNNDDDDDDKNDDNNKDGRRKRTVSSFSSTTDKEKKQWLTYWTIYGWLQIADYWSGSLLKLFPGYNIFKLLFLYWAQNDRFKEISNASITTSLKNELNTEDIWKKDIAMYETTKFTTSFPKMSTSSSLISSAIVEPLDLLKKNMRRDTSSAIAKSDVISAVDKPKLDFSKFLRKKTEIPEYAIKISEDNPGTLPHNMRSIDDIDIISIRRPAIKNPVTTSSIHIVYKMTTMQDRKSKLTQAIDKIITQNIEEADCNIHATKAINKLLIQEVGKDWKTYIEKQDRFKRSVILLL
ncbi:9265_t:CDS:2 [Entrophospora sp. SA101]|nr:9265_t:CDS:2 [Entrophospora sp. SA101]